MPRGREETLLPPMQCPYCGWTLDAASAIEDLNVSPKRGDITVCIQCTGVMEFDEDMRLHKLEGDALEAVFANQEEIRAMVEQVRSVIKQVNAGRRRMM